MFTCSSHTDNAFSVHINSDFPSRACHIGFGGFGGFGILQFASSDPSRVASCCGGSSLSSITAGNLVAAELIASTCISIEMRYNTCGRSQHMK